jgi:hypothetical protein
LQAGGIVVQGDPVFGDRTEQLVMPFRRFIRAVRMLKPAA